MRPQRDIPNAGASLLGVENVALGRPLELVHFESVPDAGLVREVAPTAGSRSSFCRSCPTKTLK